MANLITPAYGAMSKEIKILERDINHQFFLDSIEEGVFTKLRQLILFCSSHINANVFLFLTLSGFYLMCSLKFSFVSFLHKLRFQFVPQQTPVLPFMLGIASCVTCITNLYTG
jgi:hypothetical protein